MEERGDRGGKMGSANICPYKRMEAGFNVKSESSMMKTKTNCLSLFASQTILSELEVGSLHLPSRHFLKRQFKRGTKKCTGFSNL